ncbi:MAG: hypothetical protein Q7R95_11450 [bacterium]|nr:hypothetical protein [bacterium]
MNNKYKIKFTGRRFNALGVFSQFEEIIEAETVKSAQMKLYDSFEHISNATIQMLPNGKVQYFFEAKD